MHKNVPKWARVEIQKKIYKSFLIKILIQMDSNPLHSIANGEGLSANLGKAETEESTTICFSWLRYPRMNPLYIMFATKHSASSSGTSIPETERAVWNIDIGIRVPFPVATHLQERKRKGLLSYLYHDRIQWTGIEIYDLHTSEQASETEFPCFLKRKPQI